MKNVPITILLFLLSWSMTGKDKKDAVPSNHMIITRNLSNQNVTTIAEDVLGHIWMGTNRGLNKFNGFECQQYLQSDDSLSVSDNRIRQVFKDSRNQLWVATANGVSRYNEQDCFDQIPIASTSKNAIQLLESNDGKIFLNLNFAIQVYHPETQSFEVAIPDIGSDNLYSFCFIDRTNQLWIVKPREVLCYNTATYELKASYPFERQITSAFLDEKDVLWLPSWTQMQWFDTQSGKLIAVPPSIKQHKRFSEAIIVNVYPYSTSSNLILTQNHGLFLYNRIKQEVIHQDEVGFPFEVPKVEITTLYTDSHQNLWIGTFDDGYRVRYNYKKRFNTNTFLFSKLEGKSVLSVTPDQSDNLWVVTRSNGLVIYHEKTNKFETISYKDLYAFRQTDFLHKANRVLVDNENNIWVLSDWLLLRIRYENGRIVLKKHYYFTDGILSMTVDHEGTVWLGGKDEQIYTLAKGDTEFKSFHLYGKEFNFTPVMLTLNDGKVLIASFDKDLQLIDPETRAVSVLPIKHLIEVSRIVPTALFEDTQGDIWIGTSRNGLFRYQRSTEKVEAMEGMACKDITSITQDVSGNVWVGTLYGLSKYDRTIQKFFNYYQTDGIGGNQFNEQSVCTMPDNSLVFGGTHGITYFNPIDVGYKRTVPLYLENLKVHNQLVQPQYSDIMAKHLNYRPDIHLNHAQSNFSISFAAIDFSEFERIKYAYKLEGFDHDWIEANKRHEAVYSNTPAGKYTFRVKIYDDENTVTATEQAVNIQIKRSPWNSWVARIIYSLLLYVVVYVFYSNMQRIKSNRLKVIQAEQAREQEAMVNKMNMSFFSNLSHEFRTPLTMISGPVSILAADENTRPDAKKLLFIIQRNVNRMLRLVNQLMDFNKLENDALKLKVKPCDIIKELQGVVEVFSVNAEEKGISLKGIGLEDNYVMWLDVDKLDKVMTNLMSNALKYTRHEGSIEVIFDVITREEATQLFEMDMEYRGSKFVKVQVNDTGIGIPGDKLEKIFERYYQLDNQTREFINWGTGIGLYYSRRLVELHHGMIRATNCPAGGSSFTFILPVDDFVYADEERLHEEEERQYVRDIKPVELQKPLEDNVGDGQKPKLLVIDDDTDIIHYLNTVLSPYFDATYKFDADAGYSALKELEPDLIVSDVVMPGMDGYTFSRRVKENPSYCHIPIILVTAKSTVDDQVEGLNTGADAYVTKPFDPAYLIALINSQLKNRKTIQSLLGSTTKTDKIEENVLAPQDNSFMTNLYDLMEKELSNSELNVNGITEALRISRTKFYYKVKGLTGENPNVFFKTYKLNRAAELILGGEHNISEIADITGFSTPSHFSVSFKKQFGVAPSAYKKLK